MGWKWFELQLERLKACLNNSYTDDLLYILLLTMLKCKTGQAQNENHYNKPVFLLATSCDSILYFSAAYTIWTKSF